MTPLEAAFLAEIKKADPASYTGSDADGWCAIDAFLHPGDLDEAIRHAVDSVVRA